MEAINFIFDHDLNQVKKYWLDLYETENLNNDETIRIVPQIKKGEENIVFTSNKQINSIDSLINYINELDNKNGKGSVGYSISAAIFTYNPTNTDDEGNVVKPSTNTFKKIKNVVVDVDFYLSGTKDRFVLGHIEDLYIKFAVLTVYLKIASIFKENGLPVIRPKIVGLTGSGLQFVFELDRWINKEEAQIFFNYLKKYLGNVNQNTIVKDSLGNIAGVTAEIDVTFADISHVQRVLGTINQKYSVLAKYLDIFDDMTTVQDKLNQIENEFKTFIDENGFPLTKKNNYIKFITDVIKRVSTLILNESKSIIKVDDYIQIAKMEQYSNKTIIKPSDLKSIESELLYKIKEQGINVVDLVREYLEIDHESSKFVAVKCPFHEDRKYSFAIYLNDTIDIFYDFHDGKSYTLITFWEKLFNINKTTAISQIAQKAGIKLGKKERKDFEELEIEEIIDHLLEKIDTENYVYYRLANKNRVCVVRHKDSGEAFVFDGPKTLAFHVLQNQLNINDVDIKFMYKFAEKFQEKILIDAFEEFAPGKPTVFQREFIKFVNLWVPSKNYKLAHTIAKEIEEIELGEVLNIIEKKTPWTYKYLKQITQKGNILWFLNWLANTAHFNVMPTIPVVFGVPGVGKNLFVSTVIEWYHNNEYTKILNSDRVMSNFNSVLEDASFIVLDEGDISSSRDFDALKFLSGNDKIAIEKKGVDVQMKKRYFNIILFSNGEVPVRHHFNDRRVQYFYTEQTLLQSCSKWGVSIEEFVEKVKDEQADFWAILLKLKRDKKWSISNEKDKLFIIQILKQHSFGELILKLLNEEWKDIALQLNENVQDPALMKANLELLQEIRKQFEIENKISLTLINRYLNALNFKYKTSVQQFIKSNNLQDLGINIIVENDEVKITIDKNKLANLGKVKNVLKVKSNEIIKKEIIKLININSQSFKSEKEIENAEVKVEIEMQEKQKEQENPEELPPPPPDSNTTKLPGFEEAG